mgnify:CR=1 FL=1
MIRSLWFFHLGIRCFNDFFNIQSSPFKFNLRIPPNKYYFPSLHNKSFRGYKLELPKQPDTEYQLKIEIAKKLLSNNVSIKIVSKSLEIPEMKLKNDIYSLNKEDVSRNKSYYKYSDIAISLLPPTEVIPLTTFKSLSEPLGTPNKLSSQSSLT